jgi:hypothetical protein
VAPGRLYSVQEECLTWPAWIFETAARVRRFLGYDLLITLVTLGRVYLRTLHTPTPNAEHRLFSAYDDSISVPKLLSLLISNCLSLSFLKQP